jgi:hypothetical protein
MNFVNKILLLFFIVFANLYAQTTLQQQFDYAVSLFDQEKYFDAITEFKRLQFFDDENQFAFESNLVIGKSYKSGSKFDNAVQYFTRAELKSKNEEEYYQAKIFYARTNILRRTNNQAERILLELLSDPAFSSKQNEIKYWLGWNKIFSDDWEEAYQIFSENNLDTALANLCKSVDEEMYSVDFAKYSSYFLPGLGQFYTKEYVSGLLSLGWDIFGGYLTINSFVEDRVFDGIIVGNFLWMRFYSGNTQNAEKFAIQKNLEISNKALRYLQNEFNGEKP